MVGVFVHGGVSGRKKEQIDLGAAVAAGMDGSALDMVEAAVLVLEDDERLNAGYGAILDAAGDVDLDAGIADGTSGSVGAVAGVRVAHPITAARRVLDSTPHSLMIGSGASALVPEMPEVRVATYRRAEWEESRRAGSLDPSRYGRPEKVDTVGAVAIDRDGNLAAGSSTGGVFGKLPGRVGDSPVFGAGFYASREAAVVGTGVGELFIETLACARTARLIEEGVTPQQACEWVIEFLRSRADTSAGLLAVDRHGNVGVAFRGGTLSVYGPDGPVESTRLE